MIHIYLKQPCALVYLFQIRKFTFQTYKVTLRLLYWFNPNNFQKIISQKLLQLFLYQYFAKGLNFKIQLLFQYNVFYFPNYRFLLVEKKYKFLSSLWVTIFYYFCLFFISHLPQVWKRGIFFCLHITQIFRPKIQFLQ